MATAIVVSNPIDVFDINNLQNVKFDLDIENMNRLVEGKNYSHFTLASIFLAWLRSGDVFKGKYYYPMWLRQIPPDFYVDPNNRHLRNDIFNTIIENITKEDRSCSLYGIRDGIYRYESFRCRVGGCTYPNIREILKQMIISHDPDVKMILTFYIFASCRERKFAQYWNVIGQLILDCDNVKAFQSIVNFYYGSFFSHSYSYKPDYLFTMIRCAIDMFMKEPEKDYQIKNYIFETSKMEQCALDNIVDHYYNSNNDIKRKILLMLKDYSKSWFVTKFRVKINMDIEWCGHEIIRRGRAVHIDSIGLIQEIEENLTYVHELSVL